MSAEALTSAVIESGAESIREALDGLTTEFRAITRRAGDRFARREWLAAQQDAVQRLDLYTRVVSDAVARIASLFGAAARDVAAWRALKRAYFPRVAARADVDLAETFFNSITRRVFATVGVNPEIEFVARESYREVTDFSAVVETYSGAALADLVRAAMTGRNLAAPWEDLERDVALVTNVLRRDIGDAPVLGLDIARSVFYRNKEAYIVGRVRTPHRTTPLVIVLLNRTGRVEADAALTSPPDVSIVFSFTRSYFLVDTNDPAELVFFLRTIMPRKPVNELYIAIGYNKHGKTEFYRALLRHLERSDDRFEIAPGVRGMVMCVFTLPSYDVVFKIIRDRFDYPKNVSREEVRSKYRLVFTHDRAGRLVDAQEFEHLEFDRARFSPSLIAELLERAGETVRVTDDRVIISHLYTERRLQPLDLYLRTAPPEAARQAVLDYGEVLRDLAATNIFPGDMLLKNFGVSRHGRVIFYDYDELCLVTDCVFRWLPAGADEEGGAEPGFYVGDKDVFPQEFVNFLGLPRPLREVFLAAHGELMTPDFWQRMQREHEAGHVLDILPYRASCRLRPDQAAEGDR